MTRLFFSSKHHPLGFFCFMAFPGVRMLFCPPERRPGHRYSHTATTLMMQTCLIGRNYNITLLPVKNTNRVWTFCHHFCQKTKKKRYLLGCLFSIRVFQQLPAGRQEHLRQFASPTNTTVTSTVASTEGSRLRSIR